MGDEARAFTAMGQPVARRDVVRDTLYGEVIEDPYRWMEDWQGSELRKWVEAQTAYTRGYLDSLPDREPLRQRIAELSDVVPVLTQPAVAAGRYFYLLRVPGESIARLVMRLGLDAPEQVIFDPANIGGEIHSAIDWHAPSRDGRLVAFGLSQGGSEESVLHVIETDTGRLLSDKITRTILGVVQWLEGNQSFLYHRLSPLPAGAPETDFYRDSRTYLHRLGEDPEHDLPVFGNGINPNLALDPFDFPVIKVSDRSDWMLGLAVHGTLPELTIYAAPRRALTDPATIPWQKVVDVEDQVVTLPDTLDPVALDGDTLYLRTYRDAPRYQVVALDLTNPDISTARTIIPPSAIVLESLALAGPSLMVVGQVGGIARLLRVSLRSGSIEPIPLPVQGTVTEWAADERDGEVLLQLSSWIAAPQVYHLPPNQSTPADTRWLPASPIDFGDVEAYETDYPSYDGTLVPISIIHRRGLNRDGRNPTILYAYGSYGLSIFPSFRPTLLAWYERGGVYAVAHIRGGGENGREWRTAGHKRNKGNTIDDFLAAADYLIREGYTSPRYLAGQGRSAGGIPAGGALVKRPDLWAVMLLLVAQTNPLRSEFSANGQATVQEHGSSDSEEGFRVLHLIDAYTKVRDGVAYPACLLTAGLNDRRSVVWQATKMAARLQAANSSGKPLLLRVEMQAGHGIGSTRQQLDEELCDVLAFVLSQTVNRAADAAAGPRPG
jgi:prolyl oligopeptidase